MGHFVSSPREWVEDRRDSREGLPEKGKKEIEEIIEEMKERNREERVTGMKVKKQKK